MRTGAFLLLLPLLAAAAACPPAAPNVPGLGEIMSLQQMRHTKLWLAGSAGNWPLAAYELDELQEGFDDVVRFHPTHKDAELPLTQLVPKIVGLPLKDLGAAVEAKDAARFATAYDALTAACNACHQATKFGFNVFVRPSGNPYPNQDFRPVAAH